MIYLQLNGFVFSSQLVFLLYFFQFRGLLCRQFVGSVDKSYLLADSNIECNLPVFFFLICYNFFVIELLLIDYHCRPFFILCLHRITICSLKSTSL